MNEQKEKEITAKEYFDILKQKKESINDEKLTAFYEQCLKLVSKYKITNQKLVLKRIMFYIDCIERERAIINAGFGIYINREDVMEYIDNVARKVVKIIELERFERDIPDDVVAKIEKCRDLFDKLYVIYTDYTGKDEKKTEKHKREKDPILIGVLCDTSQRIINNRLYFIADWVDEYCDLTLDSMIAEMKSNSKNMDSYKIATPEDIKEIKDDLNPKSTNNKYIISNTTSEWTPVANLTTISVDNV